MKSIRHLAALLLLSSLGPAAQATEAAATTAPPSAAPVAATLQPAAPDAGTATAPAATPALPDPNPDTYVVPEPHTPGKVAVYVYRTGPYLFPVKFKINDEAALKLRNGYSWFELDPGIYRLSISGGLLNPALNLAIEQKVEAGKGPYYLHAYLSGYEVSLNPVESWRGKAALRELTYLKPLATVFQPLLTLD